MRPGSDLEIAPDGEVLTRLEPRNYTRRLWLTGGTAVAGTLAFVAYFHLFHDIDPPDDSDLRVEWIDPQGVENNAHILWRFAIADVPLREDTRDWSVGFSSDFSDWDGARASEMGAAFGRLLEDVEHRFAARRPERFVLPRDHGTGLDFNEEVFFRLGEFSRVRQAGNLRGESGPREALEECVRFSSLIAALRYENLAFGDIHLPLLLSYRELRIIDAALERLAAKELDAGLRGDLEGTLALWEARVHEVPQSFANGYQALCEAMELPDASRNLGLGRFWKKNRTKQLLAEATRERIRHLGTSHQGYRQIAVPQIPEWWHSNRDGVRLAHLVADSYNSDFRFRIRIEGLFQLLRVKLALGSFVRQSDGGDLPATLDALVPAFLDAVPLDPFNGEPVRFSRERKVVYSVGGDLLDGGGECEFESLYEGQDFGVRVDWDGVPVPGLKVWP